MRWFNFYLLFIFLRSISQNNNIWYNKKIITFRNLKMHRVRCSKIEKWQQKAGIPWHCSTFLILLVVGSFVEHFLFIIAITFVISTNLIDIKYMVWNKIQKPEVRCDYRNGFLLCKMLNSTKYMNHTFSLLMFKKYM